jgi:putative solute:sodium symporter small subunit
MDDRPPSSYWQQNLRILALLLVVWFVASYGLGILFVEPLNHYRLAGFPLGFWFAQQGSIYVFLLLVLVYAIWMDRLDRRYHPGRKPGAGRGSDDQEIHG